MIQVKGYSEMTSPQKYQISESHPTYVTVSHFFHYTPSPHVTRQMVANFFLDQGP